MTTPGYAEREHRNPPRVSSRNDPAELEAERIAEAITSPAVSNLPICSACDSGGSPCAACKGVEITGRPSTLGGISRAPADMGTVGEKPMAKVGYSSPPIQGHSWLSTEIESARPQGQPLTKSLRDLYETRLGQDFSGVRIHQKSNAARCLHAQAFTTGHDIYFGEGEYQPASISGQKLLAHELIHVAQQGGRTSEALIQRQYDDEYDGSVAYDEWGQPISTEEESWEYESLDVKQVKEVSKQTLDKPRSKEASLISFSVGEGGHNLAVDVYVVQTLLKEKQIAIGIDIQEPSGRIDTKTILAIKAYQQLILGFKKPDGLVEPGGRTIASLASSLSNTQKNADGDTLTDKERELYISSIIQGRQTLSPDEMYRELYRASLADRGTSEEFEAFHSNLMYEANFWATHMDWEAWRAFEDKDAGKLSSLTGALKPIKSHLRKYVLLIVLGVTEHSDDAAVKAAAKEAAIQAAKEISHVVFWSEALLLTWESIKFDRPDPDSVSYKRNAVYSLLKWQVILEVVEQFYHGSAQDVLRINDSLYQQRVRYEDWRKHDLPWLKEWAKGNLPHDAGPVIIRD